ncbi:MAG: RNA-binding S4 domain-containing protein [Candidatus Omnitrophica bacterium]|jgi:ribosome-associated protein|nr:RNA-binding S4 domain-containing protein [Candidatus Omnitrophota bacterium]MDD5079933.1 RNA-binding S4 domain-containing protein [Candidatus Omnitrophota bacterium]
MEFKLKYEFVELDNMLKLTQLVAGGAEAREYILSGAIRVNGQVENRIRRKLRAGDLVEFQGQQVSITAK